MSAKPLTAVELAALRARAEMLSPYDDLPRLLATLDRLRRVIVDVGTKSMDDTGWCPFCDRHEHAPDCAARTEAQR